MTATDFLLASQLFGYPEAGASESLRQLLDAGAQPPPALRAQLEAIIASPAEADELRSAYIDVFDRGRGENSPYETEYGRDRPLRKGAELADLAGFYRAFGLDQGAGAEMADHVAVECEFYAVLELKARALDARGDAEGVSIVQDAQKKFLADHLGRFVGALALRPGVQGSAFYRATAEWVCALVAAECARHGANPEPATWVAGQWSDSAECGPIAGLKLGRGSPTHHDASSPTKEGR
jgi:putative dimethyl sulfoxide reductase chaperone